MRKACNRFFRYILSQWVNHTRRSCEWARIYYDRKRQKGKGHNAALRALANRWLKILWTMWKRGTVYDPDLHMRNQVKHGSWIMEMTGDK